MRRFQLQCGNCQARLLLPLTAASARKTCPRCGAELRVEVFPAWLNSPGPGSRGESLVVPDESSCFFHPGKKAAVPCDNCGRFLCALCDIEFEGRHLCAVCLEQAEQKGKPGQWRKDTTYYDQIALSLAITPLLIFYFTVLTAPIAIYLALRHWNTPMSVLPRSKGRLVAAILFAGGEIAGWLVLAAFLLHKALA